MSEEIEEAALLAYKVVWLPGHALPTWHLEGTGQIQRNTVAGHILGRL
jgi:hypothetical protein